MAFTHVGLSLQAGDFKLHLMNFIADVGTCQFAVLDLQTVVLNEYARRDRFLFFNEIVD